MAREQDDVGPQLHKVECIESISGRTMGIAGCWTEERVE